MTQFSGELGMGEKAQRIESMVERDDDDAARGEMSAVVARLGSRAGDKSTAVNPDHRRQSGAFARRGWRPDIQIEAILRNAGRERVDVVPDDALQRIPTEGIGGADAGPRRNRFRRPPAQRPKRRRGIGNALVDTNAAGVGIGNCERAALDRKNLRLHSLSPDAGSTDFIAFRRIGISSSPAKRASAPSASSIRSASFHFAIRSERANEPTFSWPAPQPIAR